MLSLSNLTAGVAIPKSLFPWKPNGEQIHKAVAIDVVGKGEEAIGVALNGKRSWFIDFGFDGEVRPEIDKWARDNVSVPIAIKVGRSRSLAEELLGELRGFEAVPVR
jgi:hypothetical protein